MRTWQSGQGRIRRQCVGNVDVLPLADRGFGEIVNYIQQGFICFWEHFYWRSCNNYLQWHTWPLPTLYSPKLVFAQFWKVVFGTALVPIWHGYATTTCFCWSQIKMHAAHERRKQGNESPCRITGVTNNKGNGRCFLQNFVRGRPYCSPLFLIYLPPFWTSMPLMDKINIIDRLKNKMPRYR